MRISDVRMRKVNDAEKLRAICSIVFDEMLVLHDIRVIEGSNGLFVSMPRRKAGNEYRDVAHPITTEARNMIQQAVLGVYKGLSSQEPVDHGVSLPAEGSLTAEVPLMDGEPLVGEDSITGEEPLIPEESVPA